MPIYEYRRPDGTTFEVMQSFSDPPFLADPVSGVPVQRVLHAPAVHFKGKGFYNTDYGTRKRQRENETSGDGAGEKAGATSNGASGDGASSDGASSSSSEGKGKSEASGEKSKSGSGQSSKSDGAKVAAKG
jgi:putative FmdB family regulatory protein